MSFWCHHAIHVQNKSFVIITLLLSFSVCDADSNHGIPNHIKLGSFRGLKGSQFCDKRACLHGRAFDIFITVVMSVCDCAKADICNLYVYFTI